MLYYLLRFLYETLTNDDFPMSRVLNVFKYITFRSACAAFTAFFFSLITGPHLIQILKKRRIGEETDKSDSTELNQRHKEKKGTPTMGGIMIVSAILISTLLWAPLNNLYVMLAVGVLCSLAAIGFVDDYVKLKYPGKKGISARTKLAFQLLVGFVATTILYMQFLKIGSVQPPQSVNISENPGMALYLPFLKTVAIQLGALFLLFATFTVAATSNAVNITDGLDGLASGCMILVSASFTILSYIAGRADYSAYLGIPYVPDSGELTVFCAAMTGACLGFLWFNCHPAKVFMGNVGAVSLGGALGIVALIIKQELMLAIVGGIFVVELLSVVLQVLSFKLTGKRVFRCSPLHHHFEFSNLPESQITVRFWIASALLALAGVATLKLR